MEKMENIYNILRGAIKANDLNKINDCIKNGAEVNHVYEDNKTPLYIANDSLIYTSKDGGGFTIAEKSLISFEVSEYLIDKGADLRIKGGEFEEDVITQIHAKYLTLSLVKSTKKLSQEELCKVHKEWTTLIRIEKLIRERLS